MSVFKYPAVGFHFSVKFELDGLDSPDSKGNKGRFGALKSAGTGFATGQVSAYTLAGVQDFSFQEVSGLNATIETMEHIEGGENRFAHQLPVRSKYEPLELKRGLIVGSDLIEWVRETIEDFDIAPTNLTISLLDENYTPLFSWYVVEAYPIEWNVSSFHAEKSEVAIESMKLQYKYFESIRV